MMKLKIKIPAQSLKVEIPEQEIEMELAVDIPPVIEPVEPPVTKPIEPPIVVGPEHVQFTDQFYKGVDQGLIKLEGGKIYHVDRIQTNYLSKKVEIVTEGSNQSTLSYGVENYSPKVHGKQDGILFHMMDGAVLVSKNTNHCQPKQLKTVETFNPRLINSIQNKDAKWTAIIQDCDTTALGNNGGFGIGLVYGGLEENHVALLNFKHYGTGLMDAKNPYQDAVLYMTMRNVMTNAREKMSINDFQHIGTLKDGVLTFDGSVFELTSGYNWDWRDNDAYIVLWGRYTFFLDGYKPETVVSDNQLRIRPQAEGIVNVGVLSSTAIYSNEVEMHAGDMFFHKGVSYTITSKDRISYPLFDSRTTEAIREPNKSRSIVYTLDKPLPVNDGDIEIEYMIDEIEFENAPITLIYKGNGGFKTTVDSKYRDSDMLNSRGIGHLCYNHASISMDADHVEFNGFYRGSEKGLGKSLIWNLYECTGLEDSGDYFIPGLPVTETPNLPLHKRVSDLL